MTTDLELIDKRIDQLTKDISKLRESVESIAASQIRLESVFVPQSEMLNKYNVLDVRLTRIETLLKMIGGVLTLIGTAVCGVILEMWFL